MCVEKQVNFPKITFFGMQSNFIKTGFPFEWKDVYNPNNNLLEILAKEHDLPTDAVIDCMQAEHLPKFETFENYHFIIARFYDVNCDVNSDTIQKLTRKVAIFYNDDFCYLFTEAKQNLLIRWQKNMLLTIRLNIHLTLLASW
jgi:Mg2+ and Co2+ transporter CorA